LYYSWKKYYEEYNVFDGFEKKGFLYTAAEPGAEIK